MFALMKPSTTTGSVAFNYLRAVLFLWNIFRASGTWSDNNVQQGDLRDRGDAGSKLYDGAVQAAASHNLVHKRPKG